MWSLKRLQAPETERPVSIPSHEAASQAGEGQPGSCASGLADLTLQAKRHHRAWRPASAKVHKHKRVAPWLRNSRASIDTIGAV